MKNTIKWVLSLLIFFAAVPTVQASDMNNSAGMEEVKKKKKGKKKKISKKGKKKKKGFFSKFIGSKQQICVQNWEKVAKLTNTAKTLVSEGGEGSMAKHDAMEIASDASDVAGMIEDAMNLPEWLEAKITISAHNMNAVKDYMMHQMGVKKDESVNEAQFSKDQIEIMRKAYGTLKTMNPTSPTYKKFIKFLEKIPKNQLKQLAAANIKFVSMLAKNRIKGESVNESKVKYDFTDGELIRVLRQLKNGASGERGMIKAFEKALGRKITNAERRGSGPVESVNEARKDGDLKDACWVGYTAYGMKDKDGKKVPNCVKEVYNIYWENSLGESCGYTFEVEKDKDLKEAEYQGRKVKLGKPMQGDAKKFKVYVKNNKGNVVKVNFGQGGDAKGGTMRIRKDNPEARKSFRARHNCDTPGPKHKARYWSCRKW